MRKDLLRPTLLEDYIGQEQIKDQLWTALKAASMRNEPLEHVLLNGPPGLGKTTLANIIAQEMNWKIKTVIGPSLTSASDLQRMLVVGWKPKTMLFIDEVHRVRKPVQETLYPILEDNKMQFVNGEQELTPITIIGATTNIGRLERPFIDRFALQFQLDYYDEDDLASILWSSSEKLKVKINFDGIDEIARRSRGTPRIANNLLKRIRDYAEVMQIAEVGGDFADKIITEKLHTDQDGLTLLDIRYLKILAKNPEGIGVDALAAQLNEQPETLEDFVEPYLLRLDLIERRRNGRWITPDGGKHLTSTPPTHYR